MTAPRRPATGPMPDWEAIRLAFVNSAMSTAECATKFGVPSDTLRQRAARGKWSQARKAVSQVVTTSAQARIVKTKVNELAEFDAMDARMSRALRGVAAKMLADAAGPGGKKLTATEARTIASLAESAQKIGRIALGGTTENHGHGGVAGAPPITFGAVLPEAVKKAMDDYLHDY